MKEYIAKRMVETFDVKKGARVRVKKGGTIHLNASHDDTKALLKSGAIQDSGLTPTSLPATKKVVKKVETEGGPDRPLGDIGHAVT